MLANLSAYKVGFRYAIDVIRRGQDLRYIWGIAVALVGAALPNLRGKISLN